MNKKDYKKLIKTEEKGKRTSHLKIAIIYSLHLIFIYFHLFNMFRD